VNGSEDRAKDVSPGASAHGRRVECMRFWRMLTTFPFSANIGASLVTGAFARRGRDPLRTRRTGRGLLSSDTPRRVPAPGKPDAFHRRDRELAGITPRRVLVIGLPLTPPTLFPRLGRVFELGLASAPRGLPPRGASRELTPLVPARSCLGLTSQACPRGSACAEA